MIRKLLIANRGEIAVRIMRACRERGVTTVAVYSEADAGAMHVRLADQRVAIGPAPSAASYLKIDAVIDAARSSGADAVHPGYGFLSENAKFAAACEAAGLTFVGPPADVIARMGSKIEARRLMQKANVPVVPGETPDDQSDAGLRRAIERLTLPVLVKASAGGGGKGMRTIREPAELTDAVQAARREATAAFGDGTLYVERFIERAHHVEVQVFADARGQTVHLFERECSVQRRHQKVIEESPVPSIDLALRARIAAAGVAAARAAGYRNAGTVEFLVDASTGSFYFLEMNTRLQVEHPVTEAVTGVDLVHAQLDVAAGGNLPWQQDQLASRGHAMEARIYAEDPDRGFLPQSGSLLVYREPRMPGVRVDSGFAEGDELSVHYDPLIAKVIAYAETREMAIARLREALRAFEIEGLRTNIQFVLRVLNHPVFQAGQADTGFLAREADSLKPSAAEVAAREKHSVPVESGASRTIEPRSPAPVASQPLAWDPWNGTAQPRRPMPAGQAPVTARVSAAPRPRPATAGGGAQTLTAPMPGTVIKMLAVPGARVSKGDVLAILEAMKMELPLHALDDGVVVAVHAREGELVQADAPLVELSS